MTRIARRITQWSKKDISHALKTATFICRSSAFDVRVTKTTEDIGKILIVIPKKVGNAVERNRLRRRAKAIFLENTLFSLGYNWIIFFKPKAKNISFSTLQNELLTSCASQLETYSDLLSSD